MSTVVDLITTVVPLGVRDHLDPPGEVAGMTSWRRAMTGDQLVAAMDEAGIRAALLTAKAFGIVDIPHRAVYEGFTSRHPDRIFGLAGINPTRLRDGVRNLETAIKDFGFVGAHSYPHWFGLSPDDRRYYPFYAKCVELDVPIQIQVGRASQPFLRDVGRPESIDVIAVDYPDLKIVGIHTGYPWEREWIAVAEKHRNVYVGADTRHPGLWAPELLAYLRGPGREKVMFGTDYPAALDFAEALRAVDALDLDAATRDDLLGRNVCRLYGLPIPL